MKICFISGSIYPCISGDFDSGSIGGAELQQLYIGRELSRKGFSVSYVTMNYDQPDGEIIDNLKIYKTYKPLEGIPFVRFFYPRVWKIWRAMQRADADIYYVRTAGFLPGIARFFCFFYNRKYVFAGAHDTDFIPLECKVQNMRDKLLYWYGIRHANAIIVQSALQKRLLASNFNLEGVVIPNFSPLPIVDRGNCRGDFVLWVSTIRKWKQPLLFLKMAQDFPEKKFIMIGGRDNFDKDLYELLEFECGRINNIDFLGFQPLEVTEKYFDRCQVFVNTSLHEGFPNTFLQAWRRGVPVISYVDPDNLIKNNNLGVVVNSEYELLHALVRLTLEIKIDLCPIIQKFYLENHSAKMIDKYCELFERIFIKP